MTFTAIQGVFVNNLLPVLLTAATGFALGRKLHPEIKTASRLAFYIFSPCLVFVSLENVGLSGGEFAKLTIFSFAVSAVMAVAAFLCGKALQVDRKLLASLIVVSVLVNSGNYGLAATKFAFGDSALPRALVCFVASTVISYTAGILIASMGKMTAGEAFRKLLTVPAFYGLIAAGAVRYTNCPVPLFLSRSVTLLSDASIPLMLVILGMQIAEVRTVPRNRMLLIGAAAFLQLVMAPVIALMLSRSMGLSGVARQAGVLQASMPAAVVTTILAVEYELDATLVTGTVMLTTILSPLTLTPLIAYLIQSS